MLEWPTNCRIEFEVSMKYLVFFIVDVVSTGEDNVFGNDEASPKNLWLLMRVIE